MSTVYGDTNSFIHPFPPYLTPASKVDSPLRFHVQPLTWRDYPRAKGGVTRGL